MRKLSNINPFLLFLPFLVLYTAIVLVNPPTGQYGDEGRYIMYARFMIDRFLPPTDLDFDHLGNGPGYSIILIPFIAFRIPMLCIGLLNAVLLYLSVVLLFKTAIKLISFRMALCISLFWAMYLNSYEYIAKVLPEVMISFFMCLALYWLFKAFASNKLKHLIISGFIVGYMALIKPVFGYVILAMLVFFGILMLFKKSKQGFYKRAVIVLAIAICSNIPYLYYTYQETGKMLYWSSLGGNNLYWATELDEYEYGTWFPDPGLKADPATAYTHLPNFEEIVKEKHKADFEEINQFHGVKRDDAYKRIAWRNIKANPVKYLQNCLYNVSRILFNFPYSYKLQTPKTIVRLPFNGILLIALLLCIIPTWRNRDKIDFGIKFFILMVFVYLGGSVLACAETRMFTVVVPALLIWAGFVLGKCLKIDLGEWKGESGGSKPF